MKKKRRFKIGDKVRIKAGTRKELRRNAWDMNAVGEKNITSEAEAENYFIDTALGLGFKYSAVIVGRSNTNKNLKVEINVGGLLQQAYFKPEDLL